MPRKHLTVITAIAMSLATGQAAAANACYQVTALDTGAPRSFIRLQTRSAGALVPANEGNTAPREDLDRSDALFAFVAAVDEHLDAIDHRRGSWAAWTSRSGRAATTSAGPAPDPRSRNGPGNGPRATHGSRPGWTGVP